MDERYTSPTGVRTIKWGTCKYLESQWTYSARYTWLESSYMNVTFHHAKEQLDPIIHPLCMGRMMTVCHALLNASLNLGMTSLTSLYSFCLKSQRERLILAWSSRNGTRNFYQMRKLWLMNEMEYENWYPSMKLNFRGHATWAEICVSACIVTHCQICYHLIPNT